ncbi:MAG: hypothetical protein ABSG32_34070 [Terriglobia bacterium]
MGNPMAVGFPAPGAAELEKLECLPLQELIEYVEYVEYVGATETHTPAVRAGGGCWGHGAESRLKKEGRP